MAVYNGFTITNPSVAFGGKSTAPRVGTTLDPAGGVTTYYYRTTAGTRASTTSLSSVPVGAVIERIVTS